MTLGLRAYRSATAVLSPAAKLLLRERAARGKEDLERLHERLGESRLRRPDGTLIWIHGASVGETLAALPLLAVLLTPGRHALVTSGTVTSAKLMAERLPPGAIHQFVPIDTPAAGRNFLDHWRPDVGLFVDSDLWPNLLMSAVERKIPRSAFGPYGCPSAATNKRLGSLGSTSIIAIICVSKRPRCVHVLPPSVDLYTPSPIARSGRMMPAPVPT